ncbi:TIGR03643 family protein [uncultured Polaribacter sp.]|uniref:TIGR03643 family protein n=1 Tax=uncultured Polaribacter sp. TaxID=174711 RepID=UPI002628FFD0|nr:TIGR03643 family protein [uncultured Polaribacter sp.]
MKKLNGTSIDRIIEMAWEDRTTFEAIEFQFGLKEQEVINLMRTEMKLSSFKMWRKRVQGRKTKHEKLRNFEKGRFKCSRQKSISNNNIAKR